MLKALQEDVDLGRDQSREEWGEEGMDKNTPPHLLWQDLAFILVQQ